MPKYKKQYEEMIKNNKELFDAVKTLDKNSDEFREVQYKLLHILRKNEDMLCAKTENTRFANYSTGLADKFAIEIQTNYPEIYLA